VSKSKVNYIVDMGTLIAFLAVGLSGVLLLLASGSHGASQDWILSIPRNGWVELHDWAGISMMLGVFLHFVLHWKWLVCMTANMLPATGSKAFQAERPE